MPCQQPCGLIHRPRLLFLDEPTLGLDIQTRQEIWRYISELRAQINMSIFLTTHYMEEADALCDRIAIIDYGQIKALDAPAALKKALGGDMVSFCFDRGTPRQVEAAVAAIRALPFVTCANALSENEYQAVVEDGASAVPGLFEALAGKPVRIGAISMTRPSLDDVFLHYTGRELRENGGSRDEAFRTRMIIRRTRG